MSMTAIIPIAGKASRFGGIYKELLPLGKDFTVLDQVIIQSIGLGANKLIIVTTPEKIARHAAFIESRKLFMPVSFVLQRGDELWGAIKSTFFTRENLLLVLGDTAWKSDFNLDIDPDVPALLTFDTTTPERFSVVKDGKIHTKKTAIELGIQPSYKAWGSIYMPRYVVSDWDRALNPRQHMHYDEAFNYMMQTYGYNEYPITQYEDFGTFEAYKSYINNS